MQERQKDRGLLSSLLATLGRQLPKWQCDTALMIGCFDKRASIKLTKSVTNENERKWGKCSSHTPTERERERIPNGGWQMALDGGQRAQGSANPLTRN